MTTMDRFNAKLDFLLVQNRFIYLSWFLLHKKITYPMTTILVWTSNQSR